MTINPDELKIRVENAVIKAQRQGCTLKSGIWLEEEKGGLCGCPLALTLVMEKGAAISTYLLIKNGDEKFNTIEFIAKQLGMKNNEVNAFVSGFDEYSVDALADDEPEHELKIFKVARSLRELL